MNSDDSRVKCPRQLMAYTDLAPMAPAMVLWHWVNLPMSDVYGHITLNTPVLVRSLKLSKVELC
jgi:hypothetical protein